MMPRCLPNQRVQNLAAACLAVLVVSAASAVWTPDSSQATEAGGTTVASGATIESGWLAGLTGRASAIPENCQASTKRAIADYPVCADQIQLLSTALANARKSNRLVLIELGATWCPSCRGLQQALKEPGLLGPDYASGALSRDMIKLSIGLSAVVGGRMTAIDQGEAILTRLLAAENGARMRAYPLIALIDPNDSSRIFIRNLDDIILDGSRIPSEPLARVLTAGRDQIRKGVEAPSEPGWVVRKLSRLWQRLW